MNNCYSRRYSAQMERTKLYETKIIGMSLKGKRILAGTFGFRFATARAARTFVCGNAALGAMRASGASGQHFADVLCAS